MPMAPSAEVAKVWMTPGQAASLLSNSDASPGAPGSSFPRGAPLAARCSKHCILVGHMPAEQRAAAIAAAAAAVDKLGGVSLSISSLSPAQLRMARRVHLVLDALGWVGCVCACRLGSGLGFRV